jgi:hypothetical protein
MSVSFSSDWWFSQYIYTVVQKFEIKWRFTDRLVICSEAKFSANKSMSKYMYEQGLARHPNHTGVIYR